MGKEVSTIALIEDGKITIENQAYFKGRLKELKDGRVEIIVKPYHAKRSNLQSRYYWGVVIPLIRDALQDLGNELDADLTHELLKGKFNAQMVHDAHGEVIGDIGGSTTEMSKVDFMAYLDKITRFAAEYLSIVIPLPETQSTITFKD